MILLPFFLIMISLSSLKVYLEHDIKSSFFNINEPNMNKIDNIDKNDKNNEIESTQQQHQEEESVILDLKATFAARDAQSKLNSIWAVITFRIIAILFSVAVIIDGIVNFHEENIEISFVMFLTNWSLILTLLFYQVPVLVFSFKPNLTLKTGEIESTGQNLEPSFLSKIT